MRPPVAVPEGRADPVGDAEADPDADGDGEPEGDGEVGTEGVGSASDSPGAPVMTAEPAARISAAAATAAPVVRRRIAMHR